jgi:transcription antitermination factor NusG
LRGWCAGCSCCDHGDLTGLATIVTIRRSRASRFWTAAMTHLSQERRAAFNLDRQGWRCYLPEILTPRARGGERPEVLFPGYIFIRLDHGKDVGPLANTRGISRLLRVGDTMSLMPEHEIKAMRAMEVGGYVRLAPRFIVDEKIEVVSEESHLFGLAGVYKGQTSVGRCQVLLSILGRMVPTEIVEKELAPV